MELRSGKYYSEQLEQATDEGVRAFFRLLVNLEDAHVGVLQELIELTTRA